MGEKISQDVKDDVAIRLKEIRENMNMNKSEFSELIRNF